jgi:peptidoglycan endopeptidase LytE
VLTAPPPARPAAGPPADRVTVRIRRRRSITVLGSTLVAVAAAAATTGVTALWAAAFAVAAAVVVYAGLLARFRQLATEREMALAFARDTTFDWKAFEAELAAESLRLDVDAGEVTLEQVEVGHRHLARFIAAYALGWALTPVVAAIRLAGGDLSDLERHHVVERIVRAQQVGRAQSLRLLAAGVVATAGVTAVGGFAVGVASASPPVAASAASAGTTTYTVQRGDTLGKLAARFATTVAHLAAINHIADPNLIFPGQQLTVPAGGGGGSSWSAGGAYTVRPGDTLGKIAARFGTTVARLAAINHIADPNLIYAGRTIRVSGAAAPSGETTPARSVNGTYTVRPGDTLGKIAARFGTTVAHLAALNRIADPNMVYAGQTLRVSGALPVAEAAVASRPAGSASAASGSYASRAAVAVRVALEQVGRPYVYGGASPSEGFDCSGLVMYAWAAAGVDLDHYTVSQYQETSRVSESQLQPGDLVFYDNYSGPQPGHVAMYIGGGRVVAANDTGTDVQTQSLGYDGTIIGFGQVHA